MKFVKHSDTGTWHVEIESENGSKHFIDTGCENRIDAEECVRQSKLKEIAAASKAHRLTSEVVALITANRSITVSEVIDEADAWMASVARSPRTHLNTIQVVRQWAAEAGIGGMKLSDVTTDHVGNWVNEPNEKLKLGTRAMRLSSLRSLFRYCTIKRYILTDPSQLVVVNMRKLSHAQKEVKHKSVFQDDEIDYIIAKCDGMEPGFVTPGFFRAAIIIGRDLALRLGDICNLEWDCFDLQKGTVTVWTSKGSTRVELPMTKRVIGTVSSLPMTDKRYLFPKELETINSPSRRAGLSVAFGRLFKALGFEGRSFHSIRASYATEMAKAGMSIDEIAGNLGHKSTATTQAYVKVKGAAAVARR